MVDPLADPGRRRPRRRTGVDDAPERAATRRAVAAARCTASGWTRCWSALAPEFSRSHLQRLIERGHVRVDGAPATRRVAHGARRPARRGRTACRPPRAAPSGPSRWRSRSCFEDEHLLVIDKPAGLVVHPAPGNWRGTLLNGLLAHHARRRDAAARRHRAPARQGHLRPDGGGQDAAGDDGAGARDRRARGAARVPGAGARRGGARRRFSIDAPIGRDPQSRVRMAVVAGGKPARTDVDALARRRATAVSALRCHAAHRPHAPDPRAPGVARPSAGGRRAVRRRAGARPDAPGAACGRLGFAHPVTRRGAALRAPPLPADLAQAWPGTRRDAGRAAVTIRVELGTCTPARRAPAPGAAPK